MFRRMSLRHTGDSLRARYERVIKLEAFKRLVRRLLSQVDCFPHRELERRIAENTAQLRMENCRLRAELAARCLAQTALRESEARIREVADSVPAGIWMTDSEKRVSYLNARALSFAGRLFEELVGSKWTDLLHPDDAERVFSAYSEAVAGRNLFRIECRLRRADGQYRWMLNTGIPRFVNDVYVGYVGTISDMTDLKRSQEQMVATQKLESLGVFAAGIAHHFNNMLGAVFADSELARAEVPHDTLVAESIERIKAVAIRASEIIKLLQTYVGSTEISMEKVDLSAIVEEAVERLRPSISRKAAVHTNLGRGLPLVQANPEQLGLVVSNLIVNASEALGNSPGNIAVVTTQVLLNETMAQVYGRGLPPGNYLRLEVRDTGQGIFEGSRPKIFDPFYSTKFLGRGLGLAIVQGILRTHRGGIGLETASGTGATFEVVLPCFSEHSKGIRAVAPSVATLDELADSAILALSKA